eukprot:4849694-Pyramimonas_sp.AAC.1
MARGPQGPLLQAEPPSGLNGGKISSGNHLPMGPHFMLVIRPGHAKLYPSPIWGPPGLDIEEISGGSFVCE